MRLAPPTFQSKLCNGTTEANGVTGDFFDPALLQGFVTDPLAHWARETPDKAALVGAAPAFSYRELEERTNRIARTLRAHGAGRGQFVALLLPRGTEAVVMMAAILKSGAAYVPLDCDAPPERVANCLEDAKPILVVTGAAWKGQDTAGFPALAACELAAEAEGFSADPLPAKEVGLTGEDPAYVIFTSGTTGRPKGVQVAHVSLTNFVRGNQRACIRVNAGDVVFQGFSPASDGHHEEIWPTLEAGATLAVASPHDVHGGAELGEFLARHGVTILSCAPTLLSMVERDLPALRRILFGAERCPPEMVRRWWSPRCEVINTYGPTEATVGATFAFCTPDEPITIGHPLPNYACYVLDADLQPVPVGEEGELCLSGVGLATGYLGRPDLTAEKFLLNPCGSPEDGTERLYRTGDRVRLNEGGQIEWLGRMDGQVKIRGYRIELSDVETHVLKEPWVRSAVTVVRGADTPAPQLVALVVLKAGAEPDVAGCFRRLRAEIPSYMVPHALEVVDAIPVLPSGKIDRRGVQSLHGSPLLVTRDVDTPRTPTEERVCAVWGQLFPGVEISRTDDFFTDLGGHSLLAARFASHLRAEHGMHSVSVRDIYDHPTLADFAAFLDQLQTSEQSTDMAPPFAPVPPGRYRAAVLVQAVGVLALFGYKAIYWLSPVVVALWCDAQGLSGPASIAAGLLVHAASIPVALLLAVAVKWVVGGRFRAGVFPMWGREFMRWWFVQRALDLAPKDYLTGTPLAALYLRLLGARVGRNVTLESLDFDCPDLVEIGDDVTVESLAWVRSTHVAHGQIRFAPVTLGRGCSVGVRSGVAGNTRLGEGAFLVDLSSVAPGTSVPGGAEWAGSPARTRPVPTAPAYDPKKQCSGRRRAAYGAAQALGVLFLALTDGLPFVAASLLLVRAPSGAARVLEAPLYSAGVVAAVCAQILAVKWLVAGRIRPGEYPSQGLVALRRWFSDKLIELQKGVIMAVYDTLYTRPWCVALGMKCGPRAEIALPARMPYELVELGSDGFIASDTSIGTPLRRNGTLVLEKTVAGDRVFVGNNSVLPQGARVPDDTLLGALTLGPRLGDMGAEPGQSWLGSPAFPLPRREKVEAFDVRLTYRPTTALYAERLIHETGRILLPGVASLGAAALLADGFLAVWRTASLAAALLCAPFLYTGVAALSVAAVYAFKKLMIGTYRPTAQPLWSRYVWKAETVSAFFHDFGGELFLGPLLGTPLMATFLRLMGAKVGRRAFVDTGDLTEFDLIRVGEDAAVNHGAALQAHLFEDRVMKVGTLKIGDRCSVGTYAVVLFDTELQIDSHVGQMSLVMKGEVIPSATVWEGAPAQAKRGNTAGATLYAEARR